MKAALSFQVFLRRPEKVENILDVSEQPVDPKELENAPGIVGYIVKEGGYAVGSGTAVQHYGGWHKGGQ